MKLTHPAQQQAMEATGGRVSIKEEASAPGVRTAAAADTDVAPPASVRCCRRRFQQEFLPFSFQLWRALSARMGPYQELFQRPDHFGSSVRIHACLDKDPTKPAVDAMKPFERSQR